MKIIYWSQISHVYLVATKVIDIIECNENYLAIQLQIIARHSDSKISSKYYTGNLEHCHKSASTFEDY